MLRLGETVGVVFAEVVINATNRHIHGGKFPCGWVEFLPVDGHVVDVALMGGDKAFGLHESRRCPWPGHTRVLNRVRAFRQSGNDRFRREYWPPRLPSAGKATESIRKRGRVCPLRLNAGSPL